MSRKILIYVMTLALSLSLIPAACVSCVYLFPRPDPITLYKPIRDGKARLRQCNMPQFYLINNNIPEKFHDIIREQFEYWNNVAKTNSKKNKQLFIFGGLAQSIYPDSLIKPPVVQEIVFVSLEVKEEKDDSLAYTYLRWTGNGCLTGANIAIYKDTFRLEETFKSVLKHEIGHVLGLGHSDRPTDLMYGAIDPVFNIKELSEWEIKAFKAIY